MFFVVDWRSWRVGAYGVRRDRVSVVWRGWVLSCVCVCRDFSRCGLLVVVGGATAGAPALVFSWLGVEKEGERNPFLVPLPIVLCGADDGA